MSVSRVKPQSRVVYILSNELAKISSLLPANKNRSVLVHLLIKSLGLLGSTGSSDTQFEAGKLPVFPTAKIVQPEQASLSDLCVFHDKGYLDFIESNFSIGQRSRAQKDEDYNERISSLCSEYGLEDDCPPFPGLARYMTQIAGATLTAAKQLIQDQAEIAICWDGGRHHAQKDRAAGYCYVADCVLAILALKKEPIRTPLETLGKPRVMYLDLDLHYSDAVSHAFRSSTPRRPSSGSPQVLTLSVHHHSPGFYPPSQHSALPDTSSASFDPFSLSLPLHRGASSQTFARIWPAIESIREAFRPHYIVLQCGADGLAGDPCQTFNWCIGTDPGDFGWCIGNVLRDWNCKVLLLGGGGYNSPNTARAWAHVTSITLGRPLDLDAQIPDHSAFPAYAPDFTLKVSAGNMRDENFDEHIEEVLRVYEVIAERIRDVMIGAEG